MKQIYIKKFTEYNLTEYNLTILVWKKFRSNLLKNKIAYKLFTLNHICISIYLNGYFISISKWPSRLGAVEYTNCISAGWGQTHPNECPEYDTTQSDGVVPLILELWGIRSTPSLPSLTDPLWPWAVAPDRILSMNQIELNCILMLNWIVWNRAIFTFNCV